MTCILPQSQNIFQKNTNSTKTSYSMWNKSRFLHRLCCLQVPCLLYSLLPLFHTSTAQQPLQLSKHEQLFPGFASICPLCQEHLSSSSMQGRLLALQTEAEKAGSTAGQAGTRTLTSCCPLPTLAAISQVGTITG